MGIRWSHGTTSATNKSNLIPKFSLINFVAPFLSGEISSDFAKLFQGEFGVSNDFPRERQDREGCRILGDFHLSAGRCGLTLSRLKNQPVPFIPLNVFHASRRYFSDKLVDQRLG
jgi:hypothetical protein